METPSASAGLTKIESLILPASAAVTFFGDDIRMLAAGDWNGVIAQESTYLKSWHPPTLQGLSAMIGGSLGQGAFTALAGWAIEEVGKIMGTALISRIGRDFKHVGQGCVIGGLADGLVRPSKYNPGAGGAPGLGTSDRVMRNPGYYERTGKQAQSAIGLPR